MLHVVPTPIPPTITTESLANGTVGLNYNEMLTATGDPSIRWLVIDGALPAGLKLDTASGVISGTAMTEGTYTFTIAADNSVIPYANKTFFLTIVPTPVTPTITTTELPSGKVNEPYYYELTATGDEPITWSFTTEAALPPGMTLSANGVLSGTPKNFGAVIVALVATNASGADTQLLALNIARAGEDLTQLYFTTQPAAFIPLITGSTATLTAEAYVSRLDDIIEYKWFKCDEDGNQVGEELYSGTSYALPTDLTEGVHYYLCKARVQERVPEVNEIVAASNVAVVMVGPAATEQLPTPTGLAWYGAASVIGKATWNVVVRAEGYLVQLYKDGTALGAPVTVPNVTTCDFTDAITAAGSGYYSFTVKAIGNVLTYLDSDTSAESANRRYDAPLPKLTTPTGLAWDTAVPAKAKWTAVANNHGYSVTLFQDNVAGTAWFAANAEYDFTNIIQAEGDYTFTVTAMGNGTEYVDSDESEPSPKYSYTPPTGSIILDSGNDLSGEGWNWDSANRILTLDGAEVENVYMTGRDPVIINLVSDSTITGTLGCDADEPAMKYNITGTAGAVLTVQDISGSSNDDDSLTVTKGVKLNAQTAYWGASGGANSYLSVTGKDSIYTLNGSCYEQHYTVTGGAALNVTDLMTIVRGGSLTLDNASLIHLENGLRIEYASLTAYSYLLSYLPDGFFFEQDGNDIVLMESESKQATKVDIYYREPAPAVQLAAPTALAWNTEIPAKATWPAVSNASGYAVQLYRNGIAQGDAIPVTNLEYDFTSLIIETDRYTFAVMALGNNITYTNSDMSAQSADYNYTKPIPTHTVTLTLMLDNAGYTRQSVMLQTDTGTVYTLMEGTGGTYTNTAVPDGTYFLYKSGKPTQKTITVNGTDFRSSVEYFTVSFIANGGTPAPAAQIVLKNSSAIAPDAMTKDTDIFGGWYANDTFDTPWNFTTDTITSTTTLYAKWTSRGTAPAFTLSPLSQTVTVGAAAAFNVAATGDPAPSYQWQVSTDNGITWNNVTDGTGGTSAAYTTPAATAGMDGDQYRCVASNGVLPDAISSTAMLTVTAAPVATFALTVVDGTGNGHYAENTLVPISANAPQPNMRFSTWTITSGGGVIAEPLKESTVYTMPGNEAKITAVYETAIVIITQPIDQYVVVGQQATFTLAATGDGLTYQWYISRNGGRDWKKLNDNTKTSYTTTTVTQENNGYQYRCLITDARGNTLQSGIAVLNVSPAVVPPKTGDTGKPLVWLGMCLLGGLGLVVTLRKRRRT